MEEDSGSSIDGEIDTSGLSGVRSTRGGASTNSALFDSFSSPEPSPSAKGAKGTPSPMHLAVGSRGAAAQATNIFDQDADIEDDSRFQDALDDEKEESSVGDGRDDAGTSSAARASTSMGFSLGGPGDPECNLLIPACMKVNRLLFEHGYTPITLNAGDIDAKDRVMSVYVVDAWAESLVSSLEEMFDRQQVQMRTAQETSFSARSGDVSREALEAHVKDLQKKLAQSEQLRASRLNEKETLGSFLFDMTTHPFYM